MFFVDIVWFCGMFFYIKSKLKEIKKMADTDKSTLSNLDKVRVIEKLSELLQKEVSALREAGYENVIGAKRCAEEDTQARNAFVEHITVPDNAGDRLCKKYGITGDTELAQIVNHVDNYVKEHKELSDIQKCYILMIVFAGAFYGTYEFLHDLSGKQDFTDAQKSQLEYLGNSVDWLNKNIVSVQGDFINCDHNGKALKFLENDILSWRNKNSLDELGNLLTGVYKTKWWPEDRCLSEEYSEPSNLFFSKFTNVWYGIASGWIEHHRLVKYLSMENKDIARFICATKRMGKEYAFAPTINLYKGMVCNYMDFIINFHNNTIKIYSPKATEVEKRIVKYYDALVAQNSTAVQNMLKLHK